MTTAPTADVQQGEGAESRTTGDETSDSSAPAVDGGWDPDLWITDPTTDTVADQALPATAGAW